MTRLIALATLLCLLLAPRSSAAGGDRDLDVVTLKGGKSVRGRVILRYGPEELVLYQGTSSREYPLDEVVAVETERDRLARFLAARKPGQSVADSWRLVELAQDLDLDRMARLQAYHVLTQDAGHVGANELLGHVKAGKSWRWRLGKKLYTHDKFHERIQDWGHRLKLSSVHWDLETDTSVRQAVDTLMDLELLYLYWMEEYGAELFAGEGVIYDASRMRIELYRDASDKGFTNKINKLAEPYFYPAQLSGGAAAPSVNTIYTYYKSRGAPRPESLFDLGTQQLMYTTLLLSRFKGSAPRQVNSRLCHWVELGMGHWIAGHLGGPPGFAAEQPVFRADPAVRELSQVVMKTGPLSKNWVRREITNLIGLTHDQFNTTGSSAKTVEGHRRAEVYRAKARSLFLYLVQEDPVVLDRHKRPAGSGREGLFHYMRDVYSTPTGQSSSAFDDGLNGRVETLMDGWVEWRKKHP